MTYMKYNINRNTRFKHIAAFLLISFLLSLSAYASAQEQIIRVIPFTTQNSLKLEVAFDALPSTGTVYQLKITADDSTEKVLIDRTIKPAKTLPSEKKLIFHVNNLHPRLWYPADPVLYHLDFKMTGQNDQAEKKEQRIGFRSFETKEGNLYLNGKPIFLRGIAINPPGRGIPDSIERSREFAEDYIKFMKSLHVNIIRIPDNETWYDVCDEEGMMVFGGNYGGSVDGQKPPKDYDKAVAWYENEKFAPIAHHPSLVIYAMTNETPFRGSLMPKWKKFLSYAHDQLLKWDDTRVYIGNAGYGYGQSGDICDLHRYWGWYYASPFTFLHIRDNEAIIPFKKTKYQPITFTECVGNYTGPGGQYNLTPDHKNPGSQLNWTGHAPWDLQAQLADEHQSFTFRMATELFRQLRDINSQLSGVFPFTIMFHNWNTIKHFVDMDPKAVATQARISYQPVLISWECWTPQVYEGATLHPIAHVINDDDHFNDLTNAYLVYQLQDKTLTVKMTDTLKLPRINYYDTYKKELAVKIPDLLPTGKYKLIGKIIQGDRVISKNYYDLFIAGKPYVQTAPASQKQVWLYDPNGITAQAFEKLAVQAQPVSTFNHLSGSQGILVIGENAADQQVRNNAALIRQFIKTGGRVLCLRQDMSHLPNLNAILSNQLKGITMNLDTPVYPPPPRPSRNGYNINPEQPDNLVFSGIKRENLRYWSDYTDWDESKPGFPAIYPVTNGVVLEDKDAIASTAVLANYGPALDGIAIAELFEGKGSVLFCGMDLAHRAGLDPVADRLIKNMIAYTASTKAHQKHPLINSPIIWGDYASERGILTGVNSGLLLNPKPKLTGSYRNISLIIDKEGYEFAGRRGGFNSRPGLQYLPYGRRPFGPYHLRGFGNIPEPDNTNNNIGTGSFWCRIPTGKKAASTVVWNPSEEALTIKIKINNGRTVSRQISPGATAVVACPVNSTHIKMTFTGDRRLVLLQTSFE